ncbi:MAG: fasciclin domain-containing protein [Terrimonas sp.]|nr:fasciclin domain-containing protein [Terrimonas sp.]
MKKVITSLRYGGIFLFVSLIMISCQRVMDFIPNSATQNKSIAKIVKTTPQFSLLETALNRAGLTSTLDGNGSFTVFAPTNDAFHAAGFNSVADINAVPVQTLTDILLYHVLDVKILSNAIPEAPNTEVGTLDAGKKIFVTKMNGKICINGVNVVTKDIKAKNGVIHAIDRVLFPPAGTIVDAVAGNPDFSLLLQAVLRAGTTGTDVAALLSSDGPFTVFAPTNTAFQNLLGTLGATSLDDIPAATLLNVLSYHVVPARVFSCNLSNGQVAGTALPGSSITFDLTSGAKVKGTGNTTASNIIKTDLVTTNGVIHVIDQVLLP